MYFCPILMYEIDFYVHEESKDTLGKNAEAVLVCAQVFFTHSRDYAPCACAHFSKKILLVS